MAAHSRILAWKIPWTEELGGLQFMALQRVRHDFVPAHTHTHTHTHTQTHTRTYYSVQETLLNTVVAYMGKESKKEGYSICITDSLAVYLKLAQHC